MIVSHIRNGVNIPNEISPLDTVLLSTKAPGTNISSMQNMCMIVFVAAHVISPSLGIRKKDKIIHTSQPSVWARLSFSCRPCIVYCCSGQFPFA